MGAFPCILQAGGAAMSVAQVVQNTIKNMPAGQIFGYSELPAYNDSPSAVIKAVSRLVSENQLERFSKGKFYIAKQGFLGKRKPSDYEVIQSILYTNGSVRGYVTGLSLYNALGLTTQIPSTITIACNGGRQKRDFGTIRIKKVMTRAPVSQKNTQLLQFLDVLKDIKNIPDADITLSLKIMQKKIYHLTPEDQDRLVLLAKEYYRPQVRALMGMLLSMHNIDLPKSLKTSLNPTTQYKLNLNAAVWPLAKDWNII